MIASVPMTENSSGVPGRDTDLMNRLLLPGRWAGFRTVEGVAGVKSTANFCLGSGRDLVIKEPIPGSGSGHGKPAIDGLSFGAGRFMIKFLALRKEKDIYIKKALFIVEDFADLLAGSGLVCLKGRLAGNVDRSFQ